MQLQLAVLEPIIRLKQVVRLVQQLVLQVPIKELEELVPLPEPKLQ